jgi:hypothetical protein
MALEGQLSDFNLAEIFQLIAGQQKTGFLVLESQREIVFVFDRGLLISTRDRRNEGEDPLERFLRHYGFFDDKLWSHIEFIRQNSSLDLTEILQSEKLLSEDEMQNVLQSVAIELTHECMKLKRGRYHFTATRETPKGVRGRIGMNVQSVLMEAARRLDEEAKLAEAFPSPSMTFQAGPVDPKAGNLSETDRRLYNLAVSGEPLTQLLHHTKVDSFTAREHLLAMVKDGYLKAIQPQRSEVLTVQEEVVEAPKPPAGMKSVTLTLIVCILFVGVGIFRWQPIVSAETERWGLAATMVTGTVAEDDDSMAGATNRNRDLRLRQIRDDLLQAIELFYYRHDRFPVDLSLLVKQGLLTATTYRTIFYLGWTYQLNEDGRGYSLAT